MNVIYRRRRKEDLWQRDDLVSTGKEISDEFISTTDERGREDDAQLKVLFYLFNLILIFRSK